MKFSGQFTPPQDQLLYETYFSDGEAGAFLECGAFDGITESSCLFFEESLGWSGINVEAVPSLFERLQQNRPKATNVFAGLSNATGMAEFSHAIHPIHGHMYGNGSLSHSAAHKEALIQEGCRFEEFVIPLLTYNDLVEQTGIQRLDLFVLDVEGHELSVIDGMRGAPVLPRVFCVEFGWLDMNILDSRLTDLGYRKDRFLHNNVVYLRKAS